MSPPDSQHGADSPSGDDSSQRASGRLVARSALGDNAEPYTITEISAELKRTVEDRFGYVRLRGELSGVKRAASGHLYCSLKDEGAVIDAVMWRGGAERLAFTPEDGLEVIASGKLTTYGARSKYQIVIERMEIAGEGALLALLEKTRARLAAEGLFAEERKRPLPFLPRVIGVVTSPTGSVIRDILHRLDDRFPSHVLVWPVLVQGEDAPKQVTEAVRGFGVLKQDGAIPGPDLLIIARGGGSVEDLWAFNEEGVVRAIADSPIPTISAIGHETDTTLADFAADRRAPTPTAAAEMAVPVRMDLAAGLGDTKARLTRAAIRPLKLGRERLAARAERLATPQELLQPYAQRVDDAAARLAQALKDRVAGGRQLLLRGWRITPSILLRSEREARGVLARNGLTVEMLRNIWTRKQDVLTGQQRLIASLNPDNVLERGYVRVSGDNGALLTSAAAAADAAKLALHFRDGTVEAYPVGAVDDKTAHVSGRSPHDQAGSAIFKQQRGKQHGQGKKPAKAKQDSRQEDLFSDD